MFTLLPTSAGGREDVTDIVGVMFGENTTKVTSTRWIYI